jgi:hypothetical protein
MNGNNLKIKNSIIIMDNISIINIVISMFDLVGIKKQFAHARAIIMATRKLICKYANDSNGKLFDLLCFNFSHSATFLFPRDCRLKGRLAPRFRERCLAVYSADVRGNSALCGFQ